MDITRPIVAFVAAAVAVACLSCAAQPPPSTSGEKMKAIVYHEYGDTEVLKLEDVDKLLPNDNQVLIKVRAAAANPLDWHYMRGEPYVMRLSAGMRKPENPRMGVDVAGDVVEIGAKVTKFKVGDAVYGAGGGTFAQFVRARDTRLVSKPAGLSYEQAAAVPVAAITALQGLRDKGKVHAGQKVLINGASGGVGTFAVQIAKALGAEVTAVCSGKNMELVRSLGADHVIDYTREDFTQGDQKYDVILDNVGSSHSLSEIRQALVPDGIDVIVGGGGVNDGRWLGGLITPLKGMFYGPFVSQKFQFFLADITAEDLGYLNGLMEEGKVKPVIDRTYPLAQTPEAIRYLEAGHARGKVVITVE